MNARSGDRLGLAEPRMLVDGQLCEGSGERYQVENPATGELLGVVGAADNGEVERAVASCARAFEEWKRVDIRERARLIVRFAEAVASRAEDLAFIECLDTGMPLAYARADVAKGIERLRYFAGLAPECKGRTFPPDRKGFQYTLRQPYGVVALITPFNHPLMFALSKLAAPLVCGNTVVIKPPEQAPLSTLALAKTVQAVFPPGVVNILSGGPAVGAALVRHPLVRKISFTGSVQTGRAIMAAAAENITRLLLELGGKNAFIVFPDADLEQAAEGVVKGLNLGIAGQSCQSGTRIFLHSSIHEAFVRNLLDRLARVRVGSPLHEGTELAPLITRTQYEKVLQYIESGIAEGARLLAGGVPPAHPETRNGYFLLPAVFDQVQPHFRIASEEIFGPVLCLFTWESREEMLALANGSIYGLTASIWTRDLVVAHRTAEEIECGYVYVNQHGGSAWGVPFGGWKQSGLGTEHSIDELHEYTQVKAVDMYLG